MESKRSNVAEMLYLSRNRAGKSQEYMSLELSVARKTIQNWENGVSEPGLSQVSKWFEALGESALPYILQFVFHNEMHGISWKASERQVRDSLMKIIETLPEEGVRQLLYLFYGDHGSSPRANLNMLTAHLQTPLIDRVTLATIIAKHYEMARKLGTITDSDHVQPDMEMLNDAIERGEEAVLKKRERYD